MSDAVLVALIGMIGSVLATAITAYIQHRQNNKHSCRQSIMQLIDNDHLRVLEGRLPENKRAILDEYDEYSKNGGNHWIKDKVDEYIEWYEELEETKK